MSAIITNAYIHAIRCRVFAEDRRACAHKSAIDAYLVRWDEPPCTVEDAMARMDDDARDAADEIMCARY